MADRTKPEVKLKDYAGGWMTEKEGTEVPGFLKLAFPIIGVGAASYVIININGDVGNADRGKWVQQLNQVTGDANGLMYLVAALAFVFVITVVLFSFRKSQH